MLENNTEKDWDDLDRTIVEKHLASDKLKTEKVFVMGRSPYTTAYLNWRTESYELTNQLLAISQGYIQGAKILTRSCLSDNVSHQADALIFPIMLDIVHTLELLFKSLNVFSCDLIYFLENGNRSPTRVRNSHYINQLQLECLSDLKKLKNKLNDLKYPSDEVQDVIKLINSLKPLINDIFLQTNDMASFRYPVENRTGDNQFYNDGSFENNEVDLEILYSTIVYIEYIVDFCLTFTGAYQEYFYTIDY